MNEAVEAGWPAARVVHVQGGVRVHSLPGMDAEIEPRALNGRIAQFKVANYYHLFQSIAELLNWKIIGVDFISNALEAEGRVPPNWRTFISSVSSEWLVDDTIQTWRNISHGAHAKPDGRLWDLASRIAYQLRVSSWRLRQLSDSYADSLNASVLDGNFKTGARFEDRFTQLGYYATQAFMTDACVLRDTLAEFAGGYVYRAPGDSTRNAIKSMNALKKQVLKKLDSPDPMAAQLLVETNEGGWLHDLGCYRDLITHGAPLAKAEKNLLAVKGTVPLEGSQGIPTISLPLPHAPAAILRARSNGTLFQDFGEQMRRFSGRDNAAATRDALEYAHSVLVSLGGLARDLSDRSPIAPVMPHLNASDLVGTPIIKRG